MRYVTLVPTLEGFADVVRRSTVGVNKAHGRAACNARRLTTRLADCAQEGCIGIQLHGHDGCLAHVDEAARKSYLTDLYPEASVDLCGTPISATLLREILAATRTTDDVATLSVLRYTVLTCGHRKPTQPPSLESHAYSCRSALRPRRVFDNQKPRRVQPHGVLLGCHASTTGLQERVVNI